MGVPDDSSPGAAAWERIKGIDEVNPSTSYGLEFWQTELIGDIFPSNYNGHITAYFVSTAIDNVGQKLWPLVQLHNSHYIGQRTIESRMECLVINGICIYLPLSGSHNPICFV